MITGDMFGARYTAYRAFDRFTDAIEQTTIQTLVWPGGALAENGTDRFGLEYPGLLAPGTSSRYPDLTEIMAYCNDNDLGLIIPLPTARYVGREGSLQSDLSTFLNDLMAGEYGPLPQNLTFEIGNEFYATVQDTGAGQAANYAQTVNTYAETILDAATSWPGLLSTIDWGIQLGRTLEVTSDILDALTDDAVLIADRLVTHRFAVTESAANKAISDLEASLDLWDTRAAAMGIEPPELSLSAYNTASLARGEALEAYLEENPGADISDTAFEDRTDTDFEAFYQNMLAARPAGLEQAEHILTIFSVYADAGATSAATYGWDIMHGAPMSIEGTDDASYVLASGTVQSMMAESLIGTSVTDWYQSNDTDGSGISSYGFSGEDKLVIFLVAPSDKDGPMRATLPLSDLGALYDVRAEALTSYVPENWQDLFDVTASAGVDQSAEAEMYALGDRETFTPEIAGGALIIDFTEPSEIVRLTFARTETASAEISKWHSGDGLILDLEDTTDIDGTSRTTSDDEIDVDDLSENPQSEDAETSPIADIAPTLLLSAILSLLMAAL